ncbi:methyltransferase domain-containing protein [Candidatus Uhrbacteria bacterium]|nr:methyltransferase domain-containing protein [Candidatus Uhrbacteria bacterium]
MDYSEKFFFVLGRIPSLSILELESVLSMQQEKTDLLNATSSVLFANTQSLLPDSFIARLGGTIKMGRCVAMIPDPTEEVSDFSQTLCKIIHAEQRQATRRITIGISVYSLPRHIKNRTAWIRALALSTKKMLIEKGFSVRVVLPQKAHALTSVQVEKNHLTSERGYECVLVSEGGHLTIGKTTAVQPFEEYSWRDWGRPAKAHREGLLPPKIAQIMINLARVPIEENAALLDPFCGSGTILQEALLMGYSTLKGSDADAHAVTRTRENLAWLSEKERVSLKNLQLSVQDATKLSAHIPLHSIDAIVTEPYLGPLFSRVPDEKELQSVIEELSSLYLSFFYKARQVLKKNAPCVIVLPVWLAKKKMFLPIYERILSIGFENRTITDFLRLLIPSLHANSDISPRGGILFHRPESIVGRELFVFVVHESAHVAKRKSITSPS